VIGGVTAIAAALAFFALVYPPGTLHWIDPNPWKIGGTLVSNFCEEFVRRGIVLACLAAVSGFWPAAVRSSAAWGFSHDQYPLLLQLLIVAVGTGCCAARVRCGRHGPPTRCSTS
jgi:membrane protease YdiL (CAAX protease family)